MESKSTKWDKESFINAVLSSFSIAEVLRKLGLKPLGANYFTFHKFIKEWGISTSHFEIKPSSRLKNTNKTALSDILVENSNFCRSILKKRLIKGGILENKCSICGQEPIWKDKTLIMILDHINGINNDNRLENLRLVCPNCNSQLSTFCGRKNKKQYFCECGNKVFEKGNKCVSCYALSQRKVIRPTYEQLLEDKKQLPMTKIGEKYGVTDNTIRKWIKQYEK